MSDLPKTPGMKLPPMDATRAMCVLADFLSESNPNNPNLLNALAAEHTLQKIVAAARKVYLQGADCGTFEELRKALEGTP